MHKGIFKEARERESSSPGCHATKKSVARAFKGRNLPESSPRRNTRFVYHEQNFFPMTFCPGNGFTPISTPSLVGGGSVPSEGD